MDNKKPMKIVLIEDDVSACRNFIECANNRTDILFVGITGRSDEGLEIVKNKLPEAVIVDLELNWGKGSGYDFLDNFFKTEFDIRPLIVITTNNRSQDIYTQLHDDYRVHWIFCKLQEGYGPEMVIRHLLTFREFYHKQQNDVNRELKTLETPEELKDCIMARIRIELDLFGVSMKLKGRKVAEDAIYLLINKDKKDVDTVFNDLTKIHKTHYNNIVRNLQTAIHDAWDNHDDPEALLKHYTAPVRKDIGAPTPTEFVHYYADKIRRDMF